MSNSGPQWTEACKRTSFDNPGVPVASEWRTFLIRVWSYYKTKLLAASCFRASQDKNICHHICRHSALTHLKENLWQREDECHNLGVNSTTPPQKNITAQTHIMRAPLTGINHVDKTRVSILGSGTKKERKKKAMPPLGAKKKKGTRIFEEYTSELHCFHRDDCLYKNFSTTSNRMIYDQRDI